MPLDRATLRMIKHMKRLIGRGLEELDASYDARRAARDAASGKPPAPLPPRYPRHRDR